MKKDHHNLLLLIIMIGYKEQNKMIKYYNNLNKERLLINKNN